MTRTEQYVVKQNCRTIREMILRSMRIVESSKDRKMADAIRLSYLRTAYDELKKMESAFPNV